jgi:hypothetical protein
MDATKIPKLKSAERNTDGRPLNLPGIYVHKDTAAVFITAPGEDGVTQADALMNPLWEHAWEWTADVPNREELLEMRKAQEKKDTAMLEAPEKAEKLPPGGATYEPVK